MPTPTHNLQYTRKYDRDKYWRIGKAIEHWVWHNGDVPQKEIAKMFDIHIATFQHALTEYFGRDCRPVTVSFEPQDNGTMKVSATIVKWYE